ncbi:MAG: FlgO family outer membrane protein, partial [Quisquiliibacterium sp.]
MTNSKSALALVAAVLLALSGCGTSLERRNDELALRYLDPANLIADNYAAADALIRQASTRLTMEHPILVATIVKIDDLNASSTFGRVTSENLASRFTQSGFRVVEMKLGASIYMKRNEGELVLTREIQSIAKMHDAQAIIVGSYGVGSDSVMVNAKLVSPNEKNTVIASTD